VRGVLLQLLKSADADERRAAALALAASADTPTAS
jgi:hypothetical protein